MNATADAGSGASPAAFFPLAGRIERLSWLVAGLGRDRALSLDCCAHRLMRSRAGVSVIFIQFRSVDGDGDHCAMAFWSLLGLVLGTRLSFMMSCAGADGAR